MIGNPEQYQKEKDSYPFSNDRSPNKQPNTNNINDNKEHNERSYQGPEKGEEDNKGRNKEIKNSISDTSEICREKERIRNKIENLNHAIQFCKSHRKVFLQFCGQYIRIIRYHQLRSYFQRAGLTPIEIEQIQSEKDIKKHLESAKKELLKKIKEIQA